MLQLECPVLQWEWLFHLLTGASYEKSFFIQLLCNFRYRYTSGYHVGAVLSYAGKLLGTKVVQTNQTGYKELFDWVLSFGPVECAGIEGTGTYSVGLTRFLIKKGLDVLEINRPDHSKRCLEGKSDPLDAENATRTVFSGSVKAVPKLQSGACEAVLIISVARRSAVKAKIQVINQLRALLVSVPQDIRGRLWKSKPHECVTECMSFESAERSPLLLYLRQNNRGTQAD